MRVAFVKTSHQEYTLRCERADGSATAATLNARSFLAHDLTHFAFESETRRQASVFGTIARGREVKTLFNGDEIMMTEMIVGPLQGAVKSGIDGAQLHARLGEYAEAQGTKLPDDATPELLEKVLVWVRGMLARYDRLKTGEELTFTFPT